MIRRRHSRLLAVLAATALLVAACGGDDDSGSNTTTAPTVAPTTTAGGTDTTAPPEETTTTEAAPEAWTVNTDDCIDPAAAKAPIEGTIKIGSAMPLTGGVAAAAFAPVKDGFDAYVKYANETGILGDLKIELTIEDDQYSKDLTPGAISKQLDAGAHLFSGIIGSPNNAAVRDLLNDECVPQLNALTGSPEWGEVEDYPWTTGILVPYTVESKVYAAQLAKDFPGGATVGMFYVNNEFGQVYADAFKELAGDYNLEIVDEQTIEATDSNPPTSQVTSLAAKTPDVLMAVPLGAGCITFLKEVEAKKAETPGWDPAVYITNTCAIALILGAAGTAADGLFSSSTLKDVNDPEVQKEPVVAEYIAYMESLGLGAIITTGAAGWLTGEVTIAIIKQAMESPEGLTRASIINAARNFEYVPSLARDGIVLRMNGTADAFLSESLQVLQYDAESATFTDIGTLITEFES